MYLSFRSDHTVECEPPLYIATLPTPCCNRATQYRLVLTKDDGAGCLVDAPTTAAVIMLGHDVTRRQHCRQVLSRCSYLLGLGFQQHF